MNELRTSYLPHQKVADNMQSKTFNMKNIDIKQVVTGLPDDNCMILGDEGEIILFNYVTGVGSRHTPVISKEKKVRFILHIKGEDVIFIVNDKRLSERKTTYFTYNYKHKIYDFHETLTDQYTGFAIDALKHPLDDEHFYLLYHEDIRKIHIKTGVIVAMHVTYHSESFVLYNQKEIAISCERGAWKIIDAFTLKTKTHFFNPCDKFVRNLPFCREYSSPLWANLNKSEIRFASLHPKTLNFIFHKYADAPIAITIEDNRFYSNAIWCKGFWVFSKNGGDQYRIDGNLYYPSLVDVYPVPRVGFIKVDKTKGQLLSVYAAYTNTPITKSKYSPRIANARMLIDDGDMRDHHYAMVFDKEDSDFDASDTKITEEHIFKIRRDFPNILTINTKGCPYVNDETKEEYEEVRKNLLLVMLKKSRVFISMDINDELFDFMQEQKAESNKKIKMN